MITLTIHVLCAVVGRWCLFNDQAMRLNEQLNPQRRSWCRVIWFILHNVVNKKKYTMIDVYHNTNFHSVEQGGAVQINIL